MLIVLDERGAHRVASVKRLSPELRADPALIDKVKGLPWRLKLAEPDATEVSLTMFSEPVVAEEFLPPIPKLRGPELSKRQLYIRRDHELKKYGLWPGCRGCDAARIESPLFPPHSDECKARMLEHLAAEDEQQDRNIRARAAVAQTEAAAVATAAARSVRRKALPDDAGPPALSRGSHMGGGSSSGAAGPVPAAPAAEAAAANKLAFAEAEAAKLAAEKAAAEDQGCFQSVGSVPEGFGISVFSVFEGEL